MFMTKRIKISAALFCLFSLLSLSVGTMQSVFANGETVSANLTATTELKTASPIAGIVVNGASDDTVPVKLLVSNGTLSMTTTTGLSFTNGSGTPLSNPQTGSILYFSGTRSDVNAALATLHYTRNTVGTDTLEISLVNPGEVFFSGNDHLYEYVSSTLDWNAAKTAAEGLTKYGATGYLATITSQEENDFVSARLLNAGWMGAGDMGTEGTWKWVTGPENGTTFCIGNFSCTPQPGQYTNWNTNEPNDSGSNEDCGQFLAGGSGKWNDLPCSGTTLPGYVVEYGAPGDTPTVGAANIEITTSDTVAPTTPGEPTATSPTTDNTPTVSWTVSTDSGVGLKNPAYTLEWSASDTFASVSGSATTNSTSLASSALADGTWYFRVKATDGADNVATSDISGAVVIDTTNPSTPGLPSVGVEWTNDNTPTWSWTPSIDSGVGLAYIAYAVEWSQDTSFFGLGGTAGTLDDPSYMIPDGLNMSDGTWYFHVKGIDALGHESSWSDYGTVHIDTAAPVVSNVAAVSGATSGKETITWTTNEDASSKVSYGPTTSLGGVTAETNTSPRVQSHSVTLSNLIPCSIYHYTVTSVDAAGNTTTSADKSFTTAGCAGSADIISYETKPVTTTSGGSVSLDTIKVDVPKGFAEASANFQVKKINHDPALGAIGMPDDMLLAGTKVYDIKALQNGTTAITSFDKPITITLKYTDQEIDEIAESSLAIYRWDAGSGWTKLGDCTVDDDANTVTCTTQHFSTFALYGMSKSAYYSMLAANNSQAEAPDTTSTDDDQEDTDSVGAPNTATDNSSNGSKNAVRNESNTQAGILSDAAWWLAGGGLVVFGWWWLIVMRRRRKKDDSENDS